MKNYRTLAPAAFLFVAGAAILSAAPVYPAEYAMQNGETGTWNYRDSSYLPCPGGSCEVSLASLSGGAGKLTDGVISPYSWYNSGEPSGTSLPWVGWQSIDPVIDFTFSQTTTISRISLYFDNTPGNGDVRLPDSVDINGVNYDILADGNYGPRWLHFDTAPISGNTLQIALNRDAGTWMMLGEVEFQAVPEPGTVGLLGLGLGAFAICRRRAVPAA